MGAVANFRKDGSTVGSIGANGSYVYVGSHGSSGKGIKLLMLCYLLITQVLLTIMMLILVLQMCVGKTCYFSANVYANALIHDGE